MARRLFDFDSQCEHGFSPMAITYIIYLSTHDAKWILTDVESQIVEQDGFGFVGDVSQIRRHE